MPKRKKRGSSLGMRRKGYWKAFPSMAPEDSSNSTNINNEETRAVASNFFNETEINETVAEVQTNNLNENDEIEHATDDDHIENVDEMVQRKYFLKLYNNSRRWSVFHLFVYKYDGLNPPDGDYYKYWTGQGGLVSKIKNDAGISKGNGVKLLPIFENILECFRTEVDFRPKALETRGGQCPHLIRIESPEAQIVANGIESGLSIRRTWQNVNHHRLECGLELLSESSVVSVIRRMKPKLKKIRKRKQGSTDPDSPWSRARLQWSTQLLVRFGEIENELERPVERRFNRDEIGHLDIHQVVWWDETHRKCLIGGLSRTKHFHVLFPRDETGKVDVKNGEYSKEEISILNVKYEKECRMGLGCAMVAPLNDDNQTLPSEGRRCHLFNYTGKVLVSVSEGEKLIAKEIERIKTCSSKSSKWIDKNNSDEKKIYSNDPVDKLPKCGNKTRKKLLTVGIKYVSHIVAIEKPDEFVLPSGLTRTTFLAIWNAAKAASEQERPIPVDHRKAANPYESKYGDDWRKYIVKSPTMNNSVMITDYITHMMEESERIMRGTKHQEDWVIFHDALSLMTAVETKEWMEKKGFLARWVLPSKDLYDNMNDLKGKYKTNPIGNSPELMPWDAHLNADVHSSVDYHCLVAKDLKKNDPRKFDASTPKNMLKAYERVLDPGPDGLVPTPDRICQDVRRVILALHMVRAAGGTMIEERNLAKGRRHESRNDVRKLGGKRTKKPSSEYLPEDELLHKDLIEVRAAQLSNAAAMFDETVLPSYDDVENNSENLSTIQNTENENNENLEVGLV